MAQAFATLGELFPRRVVLGVGTGESLNEVPATGFKWPEPKQRLARLREALRLIRQLWTEERVTFDGEFYKTINATIYDRPKVPVPIYVAGAGPLISKYAGATAEGFICTSGKDSSLYYSNNWALDPASKSYRTVPQSVSSAGGEAVAIN